MTVLDLAILAALATVVVVLIAGLAVMAKGGETSRKYSNKLMRLRVVAQFLAIALIALAVYFTH